MSRVIRTLVFHLKPLPSRSSARQSPVISDTLAVRSWRGAQTLLPRPLAGPCRGAGRRRNTPARRSGLICPNRNPT